MILQNATIKYSGIDPDSLSKGSHVRICVSCDKCGKVKWIPYQSYRSLCGSCSKNGKNNPNYGGGKITIECNYCGKLKEIIPSYKHEYNFCSNKCYGEWQSENRIGESNFGWKGGISNDPYCYKFNNSLKTQIRNQYNNCDYISGLHKSICNNNRSLDVHHVDYNKQQGCDSEWKLIPLNRSNHIRTNTNRSFWNKLFIYSLEIDKEYYNDNFRINIMEINKCLYAIQK